MVSLNKLIVFFTDDSKGKTSLTGTKDNKATENVSKEDIFELISYVETCWPLWNHKMFLSDRSDSVKANLWNQIVLNFNGKESYNLNVLVYLIKMIYLYS